MCGHVAHAKCHRDWFCPDINTTNESADEEDHSPILGGGESECPAGCGCRCMDYAEDGFGFVVPPPVPSALTLPPPLLFTRHSFSHGSQRITQMGGPIDEAVTDYAMLSGNLEDDYFGDEAFNEEDEYDEDEAGLLGEGEEKDIPMFDIPNPTVHISEYMGS